MEADEIVKVIQACTVALTLILGTLGYGHAKKSKERQVRERGQQESSPRPTASHVQEEIRLPTP